jgi:hypothetical protein
MAEESFEYDICLSFAGEDREAVEVIAEGLREEGIRVFYDGYATAELWGKDLYEHLDYVYRQAARYCVLFVSKHYARKVWTSHERQSAQARAITENREYILPVRFDDTEVPGLRDTVGYVDLRLVRPDELVELINEKLGPRQRSDFFPPKPDRLLEALGVSGEDECARAEHHARRFFGALQRMTVEERLVIATVFNAGCMAEMPDNVHVSLDLIRRIVGLPASQVTEILSGVGSLGFRFSLRDEDPADEHDLARDAPLVVLSWDNRSGIEDLYDDEEMVVVDAMLTLVREDFCEEHGREAIERLDFRSLATATQADHALEHEESAAS